MVMNRRSNRELWTTGDEANRRANREVWSRHTTPFVTVTDTIASEKPRLGEEARRVEQQALEEPRAQRVAELGLHVATANAAAAVGVRLRRAGEWRHPCLLERGVLRSAARGVGAVVTLRERGALEPHERGAVDAAAVGVGVVAPLEERLAHLRGRQHVIEWYE